MKGSYQYPDGSQYKGAWSDGGQRDGYGVMQFTDGSQYYGMFKAGLCEGPGVMVFSDNSRYEPWIVLQTGLIYDPIVERYIERDGRKEK